MPLPRKGRGQVDEGSPVSVGKKVRHRQQLNALRKSFSPSFSVPVVWIRSRALQSNKKTLRKHGPYQSLWARSGLTLWRCQLWNLVHVLVHVRTGIPFISLHCTAISIDDVCIVYKRDMQIFARTCNALQNAKNQTQNPPTARSWGFDPPSRHQS